MESAAILLALALTTAVTYFLSYIKTWWAKTFTLATGLVVLTTGVAFIYADINNIFAIWVGLLLLVVVLSYLNMLRFKTQTYTA